MCSSLLPCFMLLTILLYLILLKNGTSKGKYPDGIQILTCDAKKYVELIKKFETW